MRTCPSFIDVQICQFVPNVMFSANLPHIHLASAVWMEKYGYIWWLEIGHFGPLDLGFDQEKLVPVQRYGARLLVKIFLMFVLNLSLGGGIEYLYHMIFF